MSIVSSTPTPDNALPPNLGLVVKEALAEAPERICARHGVESWTRQNLYEAMSALARDLEDQNIAPGEPVVLEVTQSFDLLVGLCGVLLAGGLAVPVDPELPQERRQAILEDVAPRLTLRHVNDDAHLSICIQDRQPTLAPHLAFLVYTSGSGGRCKGVEISHAGYVGRLSHITANNPPQPHDVDLLWTPSSFIGMLDEVFFPLLLGVPIVIAPAHTRSDPHAFADLIANQAVTTFRITPSLLNIFLTPATAKRLLGVRAIFCAGETLGPDVQSKVHDLLRTTLIGFYGATEAPGVAYHVYDRNAPALATSLCTPQDFASIYITGPDGDPVADGGTGEIWIGGLALANGYWNRPDLSARKFQAVDGKILYRTGDLGMWHENGQLEVLGRADMSEINVLGVRVNLPDICEVVRNLVDVRDVWISPVYTLDCGDPVLVAHVILEPNAEYDPRIWRRDLARRLPSAAVPSHFMVQEHFSLTANGKLDIQALAKDAGMSLKARNNVLFAPPEAQTLDISPQAKALLPTVLECVEDLLAQSNLTGSEDFFDLGGNSLLAVQLVLTLGEQLGSDISTSSVFNSNSLSEIAEVLTDGPLVAAGPLRLLRKGNPSVPSIFTINATGNYAKLAKALSHSGPIYNLNIFGLTNILIDRIDSITLQDLALKLADELLSLHPKGPWQVMAFCQDGCLAVEIGRILQSKSEGACDLLLVDTFFTNHSANLKMSLMRLVDLGPRYYLRGLARKLGFSGTPAKSNHRPENTPQQSAAVLNKSKIDGQLYRKYMEFFNAYDPTFYGGNVTLFISREWRHVTLQSVYLMAGDNLNVHNFPGLHGTIFSSDNIHYLAKAVDKTLAPAQAYQG